MARDVFLPAKCGDEDHTGCEAAHMGPERDATSRCTEGRETAQELQHEPVSQHEERGDGEREGTGEGDAPILGRCFVRFTQKPLGR